MRDETKEGLMIVLIWLGGAYILGVGLFIFNFLTTSLRWANILALLFVVPMCTILGFGVYFLVNKFNGAKLKDK